MLATDARDAGAHFVIALGREAAGDGVAAAGRYRLAGLADRQFAMPRLRLGMLAGRNGEAETARRELAAALELLERESSSRLLLFGGGFNRRSLIALCRSELAAMGAP